MVVHWLSASQHCLLVARKAVFFLECHLKGNKGKRAKLFSDGVMRDHGLKQHFSQGSSGKDSSFMGRWCSSGVHTQRGSEISVIRDFQDLS